MLTTVIPGSRHPVSIPGPLLTNLSPTTSAPDGFGNNDATTTITNFTSNIRRKPLHTYRSPSVNAATQYHIEGEEAPALIRVIFTLLKPSSVTHHRRSDTTSISSAATTTSSATSTVYSIPATYFRKEPPLPLYHPHGRLALSLPALDPGIFGLPNPVTVDDHAVIDHENDSVRRSSSRARRPAAKVRDRHRDRDVGEDDTPPIGTAVNAAHALSKDGRDKTGAASPRKRRAAAGGGAGGGAKRKRKEPDEPDGVHPPPAKRTRNPRGAAAVSVPTAASPLVNAVVVAASANELSPIEADAEMAATQDVVAEVESTPVPEPKSVSTRPRRTRNGGAKSRSRNSSASEETTSSASASIAIAPTVDVLPASDEKALVSDPTRLSAEKKEEEEAEEDTPRPTRKTRAGSKDGQSENNSRNQENLHSSQKLEQPDKKTTKLAVTAPRTKTPLPMGKSVQREEKEEGELSDDGPPLK